MVAMATSTTPAVTTTSRSRWFLPLVAAAWLAGASGAYFLLTRHFDHVLQALPYLLLLACPLMHLFMHRRHGHGRQPQDPQQHDR